MSLCQCVCMHARRPLGKPLLGFLLRLCASGFLLMTMSTSEAVGVVVEAGLDDMNTFMLADHGHDDAAVGSVSRKLVTTSAVSLPMQQCKILLMEL